MANAWEGSKVCVCRTGEQEERVDVDQQVVENVNKSHAVLQCAPSRAPRLLVGVNDQREQLPPAGGSRVARAGRGGGACRHALEPCTTKCAWSVD